MHSTDGTDNDQRQSENRLHAVCGVECFLLFFCRGWGEELHGVYSLAFVL